MRENYDIGEGYGGEAERAHRIEYMKKMVNDAMMIASDLYTLEYLDEHPMIVASLVDSMMLYEISAELAQANERLDELHAATSLIHDELEKRNDK